MLLIFSFFVALISNVCLSQDNIKINHENKLLWEITPKGASNHKSYLFGSFHSNDKQVFQLSDSVYIALYNAKSIVAETDIYALFRDWDTRDENLTLNFDNSGHPYTNSKHASRTSYGNEDGMPQFLDMFIIQYGHNTNKDFYALESLEDQMNILDNPFNFHNPYADKYFYIEEKAIKLYLEGNVDALDKLMRTSLKFNPQYYENLILKRNQIMATGIDTLLKKESLFIAIGAGHLGGEKGVINLLREKGHKVRPVTWSIKNPSPIEKQEVINTRSYIYFDTITQLRAIFPGKPYESEKESVFRNLIFREMGQGNTYSIELFEKLEGQTLEGAAYDFIQSPGDSKPTSGITEDGTHYIEGISDSYPEGLSWVRIIESENYFAVLKAFGGNKFMNSKRAQSFFNKVWFELDEND